MAINIFGQEVGNTLDGWSPRERPNREYILEGSFCILEPFNVEKHSIALHEAFSNSHASWTYLSYGPFETLELFQLWMRNKILEPDTLMYVVMDREVRIPLGFCGYCRMNPDHGVIEVGHVHFSPSLQKTPIATEALYLLMQYALEILGYRRYEWECNSLNEASKRAAIRLGFHFEGTFRQSNVFKGHNRDTCWFSILDSEWPMLKVKFERWLSRDNFDSKGKQKMPLKMC